VASPDPSEGEEIGAPRDLSEGEEKNQPHPQPFPEREGSQAANVLRNIILISNNNEK
jgi:hypothetical protein